MSRKPGKKQKENPAGGAGEGKQRKGNQEKRKGWSIPPNLNFVMKSREAGIGEEGKET